jgi:hypothetical protein
MESVVITAAAMIFSGFVMGLTVTTLLIKVS